jgi:SAM-dependent MidA family methyltransferase
MQTQGQFLEKLGATKMPKVSGRGTELEEQLRQKRAIEVLTNPEGLGQIRVMAFSRSVEGALKGIA